uniref:Uncharacterized protein n=1 Tax=Lotharella oceanica TaxID=641309 RepID=A0A7S2TNH2_9EUKA|mmetsp:Transcript_19515/g.36736  ORF Transcript_19515/g.36736 Transcript_19515/m.36736 type:complete len:193 (+) Transcript_19515:65-643(+)|eukprot:CAMPEP_0170178734 /NCGR_PEP_ID=MMETSP0040_2-20121228/13556_1 /TAXON_ID=641309 /ORGANISM="Lotharella oceanica, Strain CCMP622" /LENGTH=192 /DNA_ID=CAMNT_0010422153 /DNA_START=27 /DNA_END=605 /DNA_ORIENTATION=-
MRATLRTRAQPSGLSGVLPFLVVAAVVLCFHTYPVKELDRGIGPVKTLQAGRLSVPSKWSPRITSRLHGGMGAPAAADDGAKKDLPSLPPPRQSSSNDTKTFQIGEKIDLGDHMGPLVINEDGTSSYISNWKEMTQQERKNVIRVLGRRNRIRMANLTSDESFLSTEEKAMLEQKREEKRRTNPDAPLDSPN